MHNKKHKRTLHVQQKFIQQKEARHCGGPVTTSST